MRIKKTIAIRRLFTVIAMLIPLLASCQARRALPEELRGRWDRGGVIYECGKYGIKVEGILLSGYESGEGEITLSVAGCDRVFDYSVDGVTIKIGSAVFYRCPD